MFRLMRCSHCYRKFIPSSKNYEGTRPYMSGSLNVTTVSVTVISGYNPFHAFLPRTGVQLTGRTLSTCIRNNSAASTTSSHCNLIGNSGLGKNAVFTCNACDARSNKFLVDLIIRPYSTPSQLTHYEVLGLERDASTEDVRAAFLRKSKECHPDTNIKDPNSHKQFVLVNEAYSVLSRPLSRRDYDLSLSLGRTARAHSRTTTDSDHYYHYPKGFYEEEINAMRNRARGGQGEGDNSGRPYYGIPGIDKLSNSKIVVICLVWMLIGIIVHTIAVAKSSETHLKLLDERDATAHKLWMDAKRSGEILKTERALRKKENASPKDTD